MRAMRLLASLEPASSVSPHTSVTAQVESSAEGVVRILIDDKATGREVALCLMEAQRYKPEKFWLTIFQDNEALDTIHTPTRKREDD